jgi:hypothetical protein
MTINDAALRRKEVLPIPPAFQKFEGYDERRRKKLKSVQLSSIELNSHSQVLYSLLQKPVINSSSNWRAFGEEIKQLASCLHAYHEYLEAQKIVQQENQAQPHPVRTIADDATIKNRRRSNFEVKEKYLLLDKAIQSAGENVPVLFDESVHLISPFKSNLQRFKFSKSYICQFLLIFCALVQEGLQFLQRALFMLMRTDPSHNCLLTGCSFFRKSVHF